MNVFSLYKPKKFLFLLIGELGQYFIDLKQLTEETYELNDHEPITYIAHSMGAPMLTIFFHQQSEAWKEKYVKRMITIAGNLI